LVATGTTTATFDNISIKAIPGNHATQSNAAQRPTYGVVPATGRRNLRIFSEQFDDANWIKSNATVTANAATAPDGTTTADKLIPNTTNTAEHQAAQSTSVTPVIGLQVCTSFYAKPDGYDYASVLKAGGAQTVFNLANGTVVSTASGHTNATITDVGNGWFRCSVVITSVLNGNEARIYVFNNSAASAYAGDGTSGILIWGAQLEVGSTATAYQRVGTAFDVTEAGVASRSYLSFDGTDDFMLTGNIVPGTDKAQVFAGLRKLSDAAIGVAVELSVDTTANAGSFALIAPLSAGGANYRWRSRGSGSSSNADGATYTAPITNVLTGIGDIAADTAILRVNGTQAASSATDQGTGNYLTYPLYIGRRGLTAFPFNGQIFGLILRFGTNLSAATVTQTETWLANRAAPTVVIP
jgi:hypothetical protein